MRRTRFMSLIFLVLSLAFFCVQDFRWALEVPLVTVRGALHAPQSTAERVVETLVAPSQSKLNGWQQEAEQNRDAEELAFVALHSRQDRDPVFRLADQAVSLDPKLTWIYLHVATRFPDQLKRADYGNRVKPWIERLQAADPDNAVPYLWQAEQVRSQGNWDDAAMGVPAKDREVLSSKVQWLEPMERAFAQQRFDDYGVKRFDLERRILERHGWAKPATMIIYMSAYPIPSLLNIRQYADLKANVLAAKTDQPGKTLRAGGRFRATHAHGRLQPDRAIDRHGGGGHRLEGLGRLLAPGGPRGRGGLAGEPPG